MSAPVPPLGQIPPAAHPGPWAPPSQLSGPDGVALTVAAAM